MSVRVNITISDDLKKYFEEWSEKIGVSQSGLMALAMSEYVEQKRSINAFGYMVEQMKNGNINQPSEIEASGPNVDSIAKS